LKAEEDAELDALLGGVVAAGEVKKEESKK